MENVNFLELVDMYMDAGVDEDLACRMAASDLDPDEYYTNEYDAADEYYGDGED